jgi:DNA-binding ferritin-like protein
MIAQDPGKSTPESAYRALPFETAEISRTNDSSNPVVLHLQRQLANGVVLFLNYKTCAWQACGLSFFGLRESFVEMAEDTKGAFDRIAERLRMIGQDPDVGLEALSQSTSVKQSITSSSYDELLTNAGENLILVIQELRKAVRALAFEGEDPGSVQLLTEVLRLHERHEWIVRQLAKRS